MKFGSNLNKLSIKGWKNYNLNYNHLKKLIRDDADLKTLNKAFIDNFNYINLFIKWKYQELNDKLVYLQGLLAKVDDNDSYKLDIINYELFQLFQEILLLSKFLILQKVATRKIFKKLLKYHKKPQVADKFVINLKNYLLNDDWSFINLDLFQLNQLFTLILASIKSKQSRHNSAISLTDHLLPTKSSTNLVDLNHGFNSYSQETKNQRRPSFISAASQHSNQPQPPPPTLAFHSSFASHLHPQQSPSSNESNFDLLILLKKNFQLNFLSPPDLLTDLTLTLNFNFQSINSNANNLISYIFLVNDKKLHDPPSFIVSAKNQPDSLIVTYIGGLRKYSYCLLPNEIVELLLKYLNHDSEVKTALYNYFVESSISLLTRTTIDTILFKELVPRLKLICNRERYILNNQHSDEDDDMVTFNDDYMVMLDYNIHTSNKHVYDLSFDTSGYEVFPHNVINIYTNDFNLSNFESSLETEFKDNRLNNTYNPYYLGQLPSKVQKLIEKNNNLSLFKHLHVYSYMVSCYFNKINREYIDNHYSNLLSLNLLKNWENADNFNHQLEIESNLIQKKSDKIIKRQLSRDFDGQMPMPLESTPPTRSNLPSIGSTTTIPSIFDKTATQLENPYANYYSENEESYLEHDSYSLYLDLVTTSSVFTGFIHNFIKLKNKMTNKINNFQVKESISYYSSPKPTFEINSNSNLLNSAIIDNYDSINDDEPQFLERNDLELLYKADYDLSLSYLYFTCTIVALFLSGIELGIIYSFGYLTDEDSSNLLVQNLWLVMIVIFGLLVSIILSLVAVNLSFLRFNNPPVFHYLIIWSGFTIVLNCCIWSGIILYS